MWFPERAMIRTPTIEDATRLSTILQEFGMKYADSMVRNWNEHGDETAFDYSFLTNHFEVLYADLDWYESHRFTDEIVKLIPDGCYMLSVDEFIQMCELEDSDDSAVDLDGLL